MPISTSKVVGHARIKSHPTREQKTPPHERGEYSESGSAPDPESDDVGRMIKRCEMMRKLDAVPR